MRITVNPNNLAAYKIFLKVIELAHIHLQKKGYLRIEPPVLSPALIPESYLEIFETQHRYLGTETPLYLTPSPELFMKRLLAAGIGDCYCMGKAFRNGEANSSLHSSEFTILEFYKTNKDYMFIADELITLMQFIAVSLFGKPELVYQNKKVSFEQWERISVSQAFEIYAKIAEEELFDEEEFMKRADEKGYKTDGFSYEDLFSQIYVQEIEPNLGKNGFPTLLYDYPKQFAALAKLGSDSKTAERFEFYIAGVELGDAYTELTDWKEQKVRFKEELIKQKKAGRPAHTIDKEYIKILQYGLGDCAGIAIGVERLAMIFANVTSIHGLRLVDIHG